MPSDGLRRRAMEPRQPPGPRGAGGGGEGGGAMEGRPSGGPRRGARDPRQPPGPGGGGLGGEGQAGPLQEGPGPRSEQPAGGDTLGSNRHAWDRQVERGNRWT